MVGAARHGAIGHAATVGGAVAVVFVVIGVDEEKTEWQKSSRGSRAVQPDPLRLSAGGSRRRVQAGDAYEVLQTRAGTSPSKMRWSVNSSANVRRDMSSMREKRSDARAGCSDKPTRSRNQEAQPVGLVVSDPFQWSKDTTDGQLRHWRVGDGGGDGGGGGVVPQEVLGAGAGGGCGGGQAPLIGALQRLAHGGQRGPRTAPQGSQAVTATGLGAAVAVEVRGTLLAHSGTQVSVDGIPLWRMVGPFGMRSSRDIPLPYSNFLAALFPIVFAPSWTAWPSRGSSSVSSRTRLVSGSCCTRRRSQQRPGGFVTRGRNGTGPAALSRWRHKLGPLGLATLPHASALAVAVAAASHNLYFQGKGNSF
ncbi:hypothetical protein Purlil1_3426 [Purpureocillium lilacinum]|uniref:Uncharacterized protein n=1 Tax=Purpureocillium lilacinum TaxID=33203 RepID=A0ABR0C720_PURLI|nr:hypothetical protein Purlil1_3426 [Purpureocillium lilacinum]